MAHGWALGEVCPRRMPSHGGKMVLSPVFALDLHSRDPAAFVREAEDGAVRIVGRYVPKTEGQRSWDIRGHSTRGYPSYAGPLSSARTDQRSAPPHPPPHARRRPDRGFADLARRQDFAPASHHGKASGEGTLRPAPSHVPRAIPRTPQILQPNRAHCSGRRRTEGPLRPHPPPPPQRAGMLSKNVSTSRTRGAPHGLRRYPPRRKTKTHSNCPTCCGRKEPTRLPASWSCRSSA